MDSAGPFRGDLERAVLQPAQVIDI